MGVDVCYPNHAEADGDDMDTLFHLLIQAAAGFVITAPGTDDIMLGYQSISYHDVATARAVTDRKHTPEFEQWLASREIISGSEHLLDARGFAADDLASLAGSSGAALRTSGASAVSFTPARVGRGRAGGAVPTSHRLAVTTTAHSSARDAVHSEVDLEALHQSIGGLSEVRTQAADRAEYLRRPDLGRRLADDINASGRASAGSDAGDNAASTVDWQAHAGEIGIVTADGLSPQAVNEHAVPLVDELQKVFAEEMPGKSQLHFQYSPTARH